jgi:ribonuclease BN (tRNA processing enzyme)
MPMSSLVKSRRTVLKAAVNFAGFAAATRILPVGGAGTQVLAQSTGESKKMEDRGSTLILLGTQGGPGVTLTRSQTANVLVVGDRQYLIDCGYGTVRALTQAGLGFNNISNIFMTHLHNDHTSDLAALLSLKWTSGGAAETNVHGPFGTAAMVKGAIEFYKADTEIRIVNEGRTVRPESLFYGKDLEVSGITEVFRDERVRVKAAQNTHYPERAIKQMPHRSFAYRFDMADRSIVFSGDTAYCSDLVELARNADLFVCETIGIPQRKQIEQVAKDAAANKESIGRHVVETHSTTEVVGRMASEAKVKAVVLNHIVGGPGPKDTLESFESGLVESVRKVFAGPVTVGRDQMRF